MDDDAAPRPAPAPELIEEAQRFVDRIGAAVETGEGRVFRFTVTVPEEHALMGAWVMFKEAMRRDGLPVVLPRPVELYLDDGRRSRDWHRARAYFMRAIFERFDADYTALMLDQHPALFDGACNRGRPCSQSSPISAHAF